MKKSYWHAIIYFVLIVLVTSCCVLILYPVNDFIVYLGPYLFVSAAVMASFLMIIYRDRRDIASSNYMIILSSILVSLFLHIVSNDLKEYNIFILISFILMSASLFVTYESAKKDIISKSSLLLNVFLIYINIAVQR